MSRSLILAPVCRAGCAGRRLTRTLGAEAVSLLILLCLMSGPAPAVDSPISEIDALGQKVTLTGPASRIVSLAPSNTEILFALGVGGAVVGVTEHCDFPPDATRRPRVGGFARSSLEKIVSLEPDLVLAARFNALDLLEGLRDLGIPVFALAPVTVAEAIASFQTIGRLTGTSPRADSLAGHAKKRMDRIQAQLSDLGPSERPRVLWGTLEAPMYTAGDGSYIGDMIHRAGGLNVGAEAGGGWPQIGLETLVTLDPQVLLTSQPPSEIRRALNRLRDTPGWHAVSSIRSGRVHHLDPNLIQRPGPRVVDALEILSRHLHPDRYRP